MKSILVSAVWLILAALYVCAQTEEGGKNEIMVWGGVSPDSTSALRIFGRTADARFAIISLRYSRRFNNSDVVNVKYTADVTPVAAVNFEAPFTTPIIRTTTYGFGFAPFGIQGNFRPRKKVQPFVGGSGGFLYFGKQVPGSLGTHFQFTAHVGGGVDIRLHNNKALTLGYKYFHISNWNRGIINPGIDNNLFYVGYTFLSK
jgi:hypothetical protein